MTSIKKLYLFLGLTILLFFSPLIYKKIQFYTEASSCKWGNQNVLQFYFLRFPYGTGVPENKVVYTPADHTCIGYYKFENLDARVEMRVIMDLFKKAGGGKYGEPTVLKIMSNDADECLKFGQACVTQKEFDEALYKVLN